MDIRKTVFGIFVALVIVIVILVSLCIWFFTSEYYYSMVNGSIYGTATELPYVKNPGKSRVAIFMVATPEIMDYATYTINQNRRWATQHGYDFFMYDKTILPDLPINFSKIQYAINLLNTNKYDYVMYIDADAIVHRMDYDIRNITGKYMTGSKSILFGEDCFSKEDCSKPGRINSGVFIVKNNLLGLKILKLWKDSSRGKCSKYVNIFPNCQLIFTNCVFPKMFFAIGILPFNIMNGFKDTLFIKHAMAMDRIRRISEIKKMYQQEDDERVPVY